MSSPTRPAVITASVDVAAPPDVVWALVSDVVRMGEWSPECRKVVLLGAQRADLGVRMLGVNRRGLVVWPTVSRIVRFEPPHAIAWSVKESGATWTYELEPIAGDATRGPDGPGGPGGQGARGGTRLTGRRDLERFSLLTRVAGPLVGGASGHDRDLDAGLRTTLERIRRVAEAGVDVAGQHAG